MQEALPLQGTTRRAPTDRQERVLIEMERAYDAGKWAEVVQMAEEGQAVAGELRRAWPERAALVHLLLGDSFVECRQHVKGVGLLEQARALAVELGDRDFLGGVCNSLGNFHRLHGEHEKAIEEYEQTRAILVELGHRQDEGAACNNLGMSYRALKQYDKAIALFEHSLAIKEELGDKSGQAITCSNLGVCLSRHGQHDKAVACLKQAWAVNQELGDALDQVRTAKHLGEALWAQARAGR